MTSRQLALGVTLMCLLAPGQVGCSDGTSPAEGSAPPSPLAASPPENASDDGACAQGACGQAGTGVDTSSTPLGVDDGTSPGVGGELTAAAGQGVAAADPSGLPCDVKRIVYERCASCHSDPPVGTYMPLLTQEDFHAAATTEPSRSYWELAIERIHSDSAPMPPNAAGALSDDEKATLAAWLEQSAPRGHEHCGDQSVPPQPAVDDGRDLDTTGLECHRFLAHELGDYEQKFQLGVALDSYYVMTFEAPWQEMVHGVVVKPVVDNAEVLHHWLLYYEPDALPGVVGPTSGQHATGELVHGWAPGGIALDFRKYDDMSIELPSGTYAVEFHYNSSDENAVDASGVEVCYQTEPTANTAGLSWLGFDHGVEGYIAGAFLGPQASGICASPSDLWEGTCAPKHTEPINLLFVVPHMHEAGVRMEAVINGPNGSRVLHDAPFDFAAQGAYEVNEVLRPGESITTRCYYSEPKCAGQSTGTEMCYLFTYAYPKGELIDNGSWGQLAHGEGTCLGQ